MKIAYITALIYFLGLPIHAQLLGDVDGNGTVDDLDLLTATIGFTGPGGFAVLPGDADGDSDVDDEDLLIIIAEQSQQSPGPDFAYDLIYDATTGSLTIDTNGGFINGYALRSGAFNASEHTRFLNGTAASRTDVLSEVAPFPFFSTTGIFDLGEVLTPGLDVQGFADAVTTANYTTGLGQPIASFNLVVAPEPSSLALVGLGCLMMARRRRLTLIR